MSARTSELMEIDTEKLALALALKRRIKYFRWLEMVNLGAGFGGLVAQLWLQFNGPTAMVGLAIALSALCSGVILHYYIGYARIKAAHLYGEAISTPFSD